jgi:transcriptional regulator with XRE-family HTH domain
MKTKGLGTEMRRIRAIKKMSLRDVERGTGISNAYLSQIESGNSTKPSPAILRKLADFYAVSYESLMKAAGYLEKPRIASRKLTVPPAIETALMSAELTDEESELVAQYIEFLRTRPTKREK